jgi:hypothetical protein
VSTFAINLRNVYPTITREDIFRMSKALGKVTINGTPWRLVAGHWMPAALLRD